MNIIIQKRAILWSPFLLFSKLKWFYNGAVTYNIPIPEIIKESSALADKLDQRKLRAKILWIVFQMTGKMINTVGKKGNLPFCTSCIFGRFGIFTEYFLFFFSCQIHFSSNLLIRSVLRSAKIIHFFQIPTIIPPKFKRSLSFPFKIKILGACLLSLSQCCIQGTVCAGKTHC